MAFGTANLMCSCQPKNFSLSACRLWSCALQILWGISALPNLAICGSSCPYHARALPCRVWTRCRRVRPRLRISRRRLDITRPAFMLALTAETAAPHEESLEQRSNAQWLSSVPVQRCFVKLFVLLRRRRRWCHRRSAASCGSKTAAGSYNKSCNGLVSARRGANLSAKRGGGHGSYLIIVLPTIASTFPQPSA